MSWCDIFYPGNPARRERVAKLSQEIIDYMKDNFNATNELITLINKEFNNTGLTKIKVDDQKTVKENCDVLIKAIEKIQEFTNKVSKRMSEVLEPSAYRDLVSVDTSFKDKIAIAKKVFTVMIGIASSVAGVVLVSLISQGTIFTAVVTKIGLIGTCAIATLAVAVIGLAVDMIVSAIIGSIERSKLEQSITELEEAKNKFEPATREYTMAIYKVIARLEIMFEG